jgi:hypothetical protein
MRMKTKNDKHIGTWSRQQYCYEQCAENPNCTEKSQHGPGPVSSGTGITNDRRNDISKQIRWSKEEMQEFVWCFMYVKTATLTENYKAAYELWRNRDQDLRKTQRENYCQNKKKHSLRNKRLHTFKLIR